MSALATAAACMNAAMAVASGAATIVAAGRLGAAWGALPNAAGISGTGLGALLLTKVMARRGRRAGLLSGYAVATAGGALAVAAVTGAIGGGDAPDIAGLCAGMLLLGCGNAGAQLSRYAAAELYPAHRRGFAIGTIVWAATVGAVGGPLLLRPSSNAAARLGVTGYAGPFAVAAAASAAALTVVATLSIRSGAFTAIHLPGREQSSTRPGLRDLTRTASARQALAVMVTGQVVMVAVMTAAPLSMHMNGQGLGAVGMTLSAHTAGMFALSPLTGRLLDRRGPQPVMLGGLLTLVIATSLLAAGSSEALPRTAALFLLGYGWNLCFVGGSGRLADGLEPEQRMRAEGTVDAGVWAAAGVASMASTAVLSAGGYPMLAIAAGSLTLFPATFLLDSRNPQETRTGS
jgi:MFS family permease